MKALTIKTIERDFPNQWILLEVTATKDGAPVKGVVLKVSKKRQDIVQAIGTHKSRTLFFFFSGISASPDTAFALSL